MCGAVQLAVAKVAVRNLADLMIGGNLPRLHNYRTELLHSELGMEVLARSVAASTSAAARSSDRSGVRGSAAAANPSSAPPASSSGGGGSQQPAAPPSTAASHLSSSPGADADAETRPSANGASHVPRRRRPRGAYSSAAAAGDDERSPEGSGDSSSSDDDAPVFAPSTGARATLPEEPVVADRAPDSGTGAVLAVERVSPRSGRRPAGRVASGGTALSDVGGHSSDADASSAADHHARQQRAYSQVDSSAAAAEGTIEAQIRARKPRQRHRERHAGRGRAGRGGGSAPNSPARADHHGVASAGGAAVPAAVAALAAHERKPSFDLPGASSDDDNSTDDGDDVGGEPRFTASLPHARSDAASDSVGGTSPRPDSSPRPGSSAVPRQPSARLAVFDTGASDSSDDEAAPLAPATSGGGVPPAPSSADSSDGEPVTAGGADDSPHGDSKEAYASDDEQTARAAQAKARAAQWNQSADEESSDDGGGSEAGDSSDDDDDGSLQLGTSSDSDEAPRHREPISRGTPALRAAPSTPAPKFDNDTESDDDAAVTAVIDAAESQGSPEHHTKLPEPERADVDSDSESHAATPAAAPGGPRHVSRVLGDDSSEDGSPFSSGLAAAQSRRTMRNARAAAAAMDDSDSSDGGAVGGARRARFDVDSDDTDTDGDDELVAHLAALRKGGADPGARAAALAAIRGSTRAPAPAPASGDAGTKPSLDRSGTTASDASDMWGDVDMDDLLDD